MGVSSSLQRLSVHLSEWTPLALTVCYIVFSFFLYIIMPPVVNAVLWYVYMSIQTFVVLAVLSEAVASVPVNVRARKARRKAEKEGFPDLNGENNIKNCPRIDLVLVAYLPNERHIIKKQIRYALTQIDYPLERLSINVVYNTPQPIEPLETELKEMEKTFSNLRIVSVPKSTSKAENINHFLSLDTKGDIITIFDTDHYPAKTSLKWVARAFNKGDVDVVQGRCCIYNYSASWITKLIAAEFDTIYGVFHPGRAATHAYGLFGGSNGHWNASLLKSLGMQKHMLTEDIDSTLRALSSGARIQYNLNVLSYETAPETASALLRQRLRWAQGWTQVTLRHAIPSLRYGAHGGRLRSRLGLFFLLVFRELFFYFISQLTCLLLSNFVTNPPTSWTMLYQSLIGFKLTIWLLVLNGICIMATTFITIRNRSDFTTRWSIAAFGSISVLYFTTVTVTSLFCHARQLSGYEKWNPTARRAPRPKK